MRKKLKEQLIEDEIIQTMVYTHSNLYYSTCFVYFHTNKAEYVIPYSPREEWLGLINGEVYTVEKAMKILNKKFDESPLENVKYTDTMSGIAPPARKVQAGIYIVIGIICLLVVGLFGIGLYWQSKKTDCSV